ncbi:MAG: O-antigen ligase family protein, partial [Dehalococcoidia bacterium]
ARLTGLLQSASNTSYQDAEQANRLPAIQAGFNGFLERPLLGWGPENFGAAFDRHADPDIFQQGSFTQDRAHNVIFEELVTKGILGFGAFLALWGVLVWAVVRSRRPVREEVLRYAVLGALVGYLTQSMFFFDTTSILLLWSLLVAWVGWQEVRQPQPQAGEIEGAGGYPRLTLALDRLGSKILQGISRPWSRQAVTIGVAVFLGVSLYLWNYLPYQAAASLGESLRAGYPVSQRLALTEQGIDTFPQLANLPRRLVIVQLYGQWDWLGAEDRQLALDFVARQANQGLAADPTDGPLLISTIVFVQRATQTVEAKTALGPLLERLDTVAPHRIETHWLRANQAVQQGDYEGAITIMNAFLERSPGTERFFTGIRQAALDGLGPQGN